VPANGYINIIFDNGLVINEVTSSSCEIWRIATLNYGPAKSCFKRGREISIQLDAEQYTKGAIYSVRLNFMIQSPEKSGTFFADVSMRQPDFNTWIHSYTERIVFRPAVFSFPQNFLYPKEKAIRSVLDFAFNTPFDIPHSRPQNITTEVVSFISIGFEPSGPTSIPSDLAYGADFPEFLPCVELQGLTPVEGTHITCKVVSLDSPTIIIRNYQAVKKGSRIRISLGSFLNPDGNFIARISIISKFNRILSKIAEHAETFQVTNTIPRKP
jgi:hypothetical protein